MTQGSTPASSNQPDLIKDAQTFKGARYHRAEFSIPTYDDGYGPLWISRNSIGINGIVRARTWEDAYEICEDEFFPEADETLEALVKEYGFKRDHVKMIRDAQGIRPATREDYGPDGLKDGITFDSWRTIETPDPDAWPENALFQDAYGFRPNGPNARDKHKHGIYAKDLNGDALDVLTADMVQELGITLDIGEEESE